MDSTRRLLIHAGQLEQGLADAFDAGHVSTELPRSAERVTDQVAELFCRTFNGEVAHLRQVDAVELPVIDLQIKVPEGFEFYTLYPEQYVEAAREWCRRHSAAGNKSVLVVGIRSIGTTLSAVVGAVLRAAGWKVQRCTVRPKGHPFQRSVVGPIQNDADYAIIVDEGPGMSGSSMVAAAEWVLASGIARDGITFFPGHAGLPGHAASKAVLNWWQTTPRIFVPQKNLIWDGCTLKQMLRRRSEEVLQSRMVRFHDLDGGEWRRWAYATAEEWPPAFAPFERSKYLCEDEKGEAIIWKFNGLGSWDGSEMQGADKKTSPFAIHPVAEVHGFIGFLWIRGMRLTRESPRVNDVIATLVEHILAVAKAPLDPREHEEATERLAEMTFWNTKYLLGDAAAQRTVQSRAAATLSGDLPSYGDGHLAPFEWIQRENGTARKSDTFGHDRDHTVVGRQSVLWDVAGAAVEWNFSAIQTKRLCSAFAARGFRIDPPALTFFRNAYAAFQAGKSSLCRDMVSDPQEKARLTDAMQFYCNVLSGK